MLHSFRINQSICFQTENGDEHHTISTTKLSEDAVKVTMSNLRPQVQSAIRNFLQSQNGNHIPSDVLRVIQEEAALMKETEDVRDMLEGDPFEQFDDVQMQVQRLKSLIQVTSCSRVRTRHYIGIDAVVTIQNGQNLQLTFKYEQKPRQATKGSHVWYSIEMSHNHAQRENLLVAQVWAPGDAPCTTSPAVCINQPAEEDSWEHDDEVEILEAENLQRVDSDDSPPSSPKTRKKPKISSTPESQFGDHMHDGDDEAGEEETNDSFMAFMDPDLLHTFLDAARIGPMDEGTAFFLLMTFPFYESEWDLVGYVLDEVFGGGDGEEIDEMKEG
jgi:hypothetical protein